MPDERFRRPVSPLNFVPLNFVPLNFVPANEWRVIPKILNSLMICEKSGIEYIHIETFILKVLPTVEEGPFFE